MHHSALTGHLLPAGWTVLEGVGAGGRGERFQRHQRIRPTRSLPRCVPRPALRAEDGVLTARRLVEVAAPLQSRLTLETPQIILVHTLYRS